MSVVPEGKTKLPSSTLIKKSEQAIGINMLWHHHYNKGADALRNGGKSEFLSARVGYGVRATVVVMRTMVALTAIAPYHAWDLRAFKKRASEEGFNPKGNGSIPAAAETIIRFAQSDPNEPFVENESILVGSGNLTRTSVCDDIDIVLDEGEMDPGPITGNGDQSALQEELISVD